MAEKQPDNAERHDAGGRVVYSRLHAEGEGAAARTPAAPGGGLHLPGGREVEPWLPVLVVSFALLVGVVVALGWLSESEVRSVSSNVQLSERGQSIRIKSLLQLRDALVTLNGEARTRQEQLARHEQQGDFIIPFELKLGRARDQLQAQLPNFDRLPLAQTAQGRAFHQTLDEYLHVNEDARRYSLEGFPRFRVLSAQLDQFLDQTAHEQEDLVQQRLRMEESAAERIRRLAFFAAALAVLIAAFAVWELQRRFRQLRASLTESRRERAFSTQMLEGMVSAVAALDAHARIRSANRAFFQLFPRAAVGASVYDDIGDSEGLKLLAAATVGRVTDVTYHGRWLLNAQHEQNTNGDGHTPKPQRSFDVYSSPLNLDGAQGQILTLVDVTQAAATETELRRKTSLAAVGQASAQVAHEIRNPLGSIRLGVAMLRDMTDDAEAHHTIDLIERGIAHLNKLTVDVTEFARDRELARTETNVHELLDASLELVAEKLQAKETPIERHYTNEPLVGALDADQLRQIFVNLLANAVDASAERAPVSITTQSIMMQPAAAGANGDHGRASGTVVPAARVTITDHGHGVDEQTRARIFEPFFTTKKSGTGLGLAIVKKIIEQHNGRVSVESAPGEGTSFHVELPLKAARATANS